MAFPAIESINPAADSSTGGAATGGDSSSVSHSVVLPATVSAGALLMVVGRKDANSTSIAFPAGWTVNQSDADGANDVAFWAYMDTFAVGNEDGTSITVSSTSGAKLGAVSLSITGAANPATRPPEASTVATGASTTPDPTTCTPTGGAKDYLWLWLGTWEGEQTLSKTQPTNFTDRADVSTGTGGAITANVQLKCCDRQFNAASLDAGSVTLSASDDWIAWTIAVHPFVASTSVVWEDRRMRTRTPRMAANPGLVAR